MTDRKRPNIPEAPGLGWRERKHGWIAAWYARPDLIRKGYTPKTWRLWQGAWPDDDDTAKIIATCKSLQADMLAWSGSNRPDVKKAAKRQKEMCVNVYFITDGDLIKIGFSRSVEHRRQGLQARIGSKMTTVAAFRAGQNDEWMLHRHFEHLRVEGEWFRNTPEMSAFIANMEKERVRLRAGHITIEDMIREAETLRWAHVA